MLHNMLVLYFFTIFYLPLIYSKPLSVEKKEIMNQLANFKFDSLFDNFHFTSCADECFLTTPESSSKSLTEAFFSNLKNHDKMCQNSNSIESCIKKKNCKNDWMADTYLLTSKIACQKYNKDDANVNGALDKFKCLGNDANKFVDKCSKSCGVQTTIEKITNLDNDVKMVNFVNEEDKKILALPDVSPVCQSSTCFLTCLSNNIDKECEKKQLNSFMNVFENFFRSEGSLLAGGEVRDVKSYFEYLVQTQCQNLAVPNDVVKIDEIKNISPSVGKVVSVPASSPSKNEECEGCGKDRFDYMYKKNSTQVLSTLISQIRSSLDMLL